MQRECVYMHAQELKRKRIPELFIFSSTEHIFCKSVNTICEGDSRSVSTDMPKCVRKYASDRLTWTRWVIFNKIMHLSPVCLITAILPTVTKPHIQARMSFLAFM